MTTTAARPIEIRTLTPDHGMVDDAPVGRGPHLSIYAACIALVVAHAQRAQRPVVVHALDTVSAPTEYWLEVHPDGRVIPTGVASSPSTGDPAPGDPNLGMISPPPFPADSEDQTPAATTGAAGAPPAEPRITPLPSLSVPGPIAHPGDAPGAAAAEKPDRRWRRDRESTPAEPPVGFTDVAVEPRRPDHSEATGAPKPESAAPRHQHRNPTPVPVTGPRRAAGHAQVSNPAPAAETSGPATGPLRSEAPAPTVNTPAGPDQRPPTLNDLLGHRPPPPAAPASNGWPGRLRRWTGGAISPKPSRAESTQRIAVAAVQRSLTGPKTVVVINPKGGADKTTATLLIAATFGIHRGGYTLAWDNNETRGTMGWRAVPGRHTNTAVDLLRELDRFSVIDSARVGDLDNFVRAQGSAQFDVLASDEDAASAASIDADAFNALHRSLSRFYRVMVIDTGNNMRASNWQAAVAAADQLVIVSTVREDTGQSAAWVADALHAAGQGAKVRSAVTVLAAPGPKSDRALAFRLREHFTGLTRAVVEVPFDGSLVAGGPIDVTALTPASRAAWLTVTAAIADGF